VTIPVISGSAFPAVPSVFSVASLSAWALKSTGRKQATEGTEDTEEIDHRLRVYSAGCVGSVSAVATTYKECRAGTPVTATGTVALLFSERAFLVASLRFRAVRPGVDATPWAHYLSAMRTAGLVRFGQQNKSIGATDTFRARGFR